MHADKERKVGSNLFLLARVAGGGQLDVPAGNGVLSLVLLFWAVLRLVYTVEMADLTKLRSSAAAMASVSKIPIATTKRAEIGLGGSGLTGGGRRLGDGSVRGRRGASGGSGGGVGGEWAGAGGDRVGRGAREEEVGDVAQRLRRRTPLPLHLRAAVPLRRRRCRGSSGRLHRIAESSR